MVWRNFQSNVFWYFKLLYENSRFHKDSNFQSGSSLESVWVHSLTFSCTPKNVNVTHGLHFWPIPFHALVLVTSPKLESRQINLNLRVFLKNPKTGQHWLKYKNYVIDRWSGFLCLMGANFFDLILLCVLDWCVPKFLVRPKVGLSYSNSGIVKNSGHVPSSQH